MGGDWTGSLSQHFPPNKSTIFPSDFSDRLRIVTARVLLRILYLPYNAWRYRESCGRLGRDQLRPDARTQGISHSQRYLTLRPALRHLGFAKPVTGRANPEEYYVSGSSNRSPEGAAAAQASDWRVDAISPRAVDAAACFTEKMETTPADTPE